MRKWLTPAVIAPALLCGSVRAVACTVFSASDDRTALVGANEDAPFPRGKITFLPAEDGKYGRVYFGFAGALWAQAGMNDQGLFFDGLSADAQRVTKSRHKPRPGSFLLETIMEECATVEEALAVFDRYNLSFLERAMYLLADRTGHSAILEGEAVVRKTGAYQVATNFRQSQAKPGAYPCDRYNLAAEMLSEELAEGNLSADLFRSVLASTHVESPPSPTVYSTICDLKRGVIYVYHYHNFTNVFEINLAEELKKGRHVYDLPSLFPRTLMAEYFERMFRRGETGYRGPRYPETSDEEGQADAGITGLAVASRWGRLTVPIAGGAAVAALLVNRRRARARQARHWRSDS